MQISGSGTPPLFRLSLTPQMQKALPLHNGETVTATIQPGKTPGMLNLDINGKLLQVVSTLRLTAGMTLQLRVEKSNDQVLLHLDDKTLRQLTHNQALRQSLPLQEPLKPLFERLQQVVAMTPGNSPTTPAAQAAAQPSVTSPGTNATATTPTTQQGQAASEEKGKVASQTRDAAPAPGATKSPQELPPPALPRQVRQAIEKLLAVLPPLKQITEADGLKQAIASSGMFLESSLLQRQSNTPDKDVKTALLRLAQIIRQSLSEGESNQHTETIRSRDLLQALLKQVDSGVARVQMNQLHSLATQQAQGEERQFMTLELPLLPPQGNNIDVLQLRIQREKSKSRSGAEDCWSVTLHLSPADYGDIHAVVSLTGGKVSTTFWCTNEQTGQLFNQQLDELQRRLSEQGLDIGRFAAITGTAPEGAAQELSTQSSGLIDTQA